MAFIQVAIAVIVHEGRILLTRRAAGDRFADLWEFPGGKLLPKESPQECVRRELSEELGIEITPMAMLAPLSHDYGDFKVTLHPFIVTIASGEPVSAGGNAMQWVEPDELASLSFPQGSVPLLSQIPHILQSLGLSG